MRIEKHHQAIAQLGCDEGCWRIDRSEFDENQTVFGFQEAQASYIPCQFGAKARCDGIGLAEPVPADFGWCECCIWIAEAYRGFESSAGHHAGGTLRFGAPYSGDLGKEITVGIS